MDKPKDFKLSPYELSVLVCGTCGKSDRLYKDAHGVFCHRCGPSAGIQTRYIGEAVKP